MVLHDLLQVVEHDLGRCMLERRVVQHRFGEGASVAESDVAGTDDLKTLRALYQGPQRLVVGLNGVFRQRGVPKVKTMSRLQC